jgi:hypothetical protein
MLAETSLLVLLDLVSLLRVSTVQMVASGTTQFGSTASFTVLVQTGPIFEQVLGTS